MTRRPRSSSSSFSTKKFDVFEFNEEDHSIEKVSKRILRKFQNPSKSRSSSITKYDFLQAFASGSNCRPVSIDITADHIDLDDEQEEEVTRCSVEKLADQPLEVVDDDDGREHDDGYDREKIDTQSSIDTPLPLSADKEISGCGDFVESDFDWKNQSLGVASDDDDDASQMSSSSTSSSNPPEDEVDFRDQLVEHDDSAAFVINVEEKVVDVIPDFIQFEDLYSTRSQLTFSCNSLKLEGSTSNGTRETLKIEWPTEDIIKIESCWFENIETALINLLLKSKDYSEAGNTNQNPVYADFKLLKFAVYDSFWYKAEEAIKLLDTRYTDIWSTLFDINVDNSGNISALGQHYFFSQNRYFPNFDEAFDEVIYPKGEPDAVSISKRDVELLQPQTFINDTIIDFYIKYLKNKLPTDEQDRFHFFNSFFFRKLADLDKDPASACDGRAAFQRVRKWTRKVNLFEKDYILIPINYSFHWSLIAICHPGEVTCYQDEEMNESSKIPCILHMDSLQGTHKGLKNIFQSYLCEEWKERHGNVVDDVSSKFLHMRFISLELPQQDNLYDCGLFLLHYVERFLEEAPVNFNPFMITKFSDFLSSNWFPPPEASLKRSHIQNLIYDIFENNSLQARPTDCLDKGLPSEDPAIVVQTKVEEDSLTGCSYSDLWCVKSPLNSSTELETADIQYPTASPGRVSPCMGGPAVVSKDWRVISRSDCLQMSACHKRGFLSPLKEIDECSEETAVSVEREKSQLVYDFPSTSYVRKDHGASESSEHGLSVNFMKAVDDHSLSRTCARLSSFPLNTSTHENQLLKKIDESKVEDKTVVDYPSTSGEELTDYVVPDSPAANDADKRSLEEDTIVNKEKAVTFESDEDAKRPNPMNAYVIPDSPEADDGHDADMIIIVDSPSSFREYEPDAKRPKLMNQDGAPRRMLTRRMLKGACVL
ncbi:probable ubiquitin-like-specific protease 2A isoform X4 [Vigna radiata var. radiata]|uniref:Probable ubiquitin-like-specific protease 2A isoform X4 n=1 Tax=Vigna radiata var. radiata TaxID=3916 RepID=A0A1S3VLA6_VIGRR|nr:probable ubiquitin-like-specific protease 2A isoform X4 [Vigna radiata var. radiata]